MKPPKLPTLDLNGYRVCALRFRQVGPARTGWPHPVILEPGFPPFARTRTDRLIRSGSQAEQRMRGSHTAVHDDGQPRFPGDLPGYL